MGVRAHISARGVTRCAASGGDAWRRGADSPFRPGNHARRRARAALAFDAARPRLAAGAHRRAEAGDRRVEGLDALQFRAHLRSGRCSRRVLPEIYRWRWPRGWEVELGKSTSPLTLDASCDDGWRGCARTECEARARTYAARGSRARPAEVWRAAGLVRMGAWRAQAVGRDRPPSTKSVHSWRERHGSAMRSLSPFLAPTERPRGRHPRVEMVR